MAGQITCRKDGETSALAARLAPVLRPGDTVLLDGPVGAGKSLFARSLIATRLAEFGIVEDIPSPSFTLIQTYQAGPVAIIHADLYRLGADDLYELGLEADLDDAIALIEWPDRLGALTPARWLKIAFALDAQNADTRYVSAEYTGPDWDAAQTILSAMAMS